MTRRIVVRGRVQGVFYRGWTVETASALGLTGWVRNRRDGTVEILACGEAISIDALVKLCGRGPPAARVEKVEAADSDEPCPPDFASRATV